jgi:hypothetical protein
VSHYDTHTLCNGDGCDACGHTGVVHCYITDCPNQPGRPT